MDFSCNHTAPAHDLLIFQLTTAYQYPEWLFFVDEFYWGDLAYKLTSIYLLVYKQPAVSLPQNQRSDIILVAI